MVQEVMAPEERHLRTLFLSLGGLMLFTFFILLKVGGDTQLQYVPWLSLYKIHLLSELSIPYFTPGYCGGYLLAAYPHSLILTPHMLATLVMPNAYWAIKIVNLVITIVFGVGMYSWLKWFGVRNELARTIAALLVTVSGWWVLRMVDAGHLGVSGIAYTPWIMVLIEILLRRRPEPKRGYISLVAALIALFFLLINSVHVWLLTSVPIIAARCVVEIFPAPKRASKETFASLGIVVLSGLFAILLSGPRLGGIYEFALTKFPRIGTGIAPHFQVIEDTRLLLTWITRSLFDAKFMVDADANRVLGSYWEYSNFIGLFSVPALILGLLKSKHLLKSRAFTSLLIAALFQLAITRTPYVADLVRYLVPVYKSITWYWRGSIILVFCVSVMVACGYEHLFDKRRALATWTGVVLALVNLGEIHYAYQFDGRHTRFETPFIGFLTETMPPKPYSSHMSGTCYDPLFGYSGEYYHGVFAEGSVYESRDAEYYNMHDVRRLAGDEAEDSHFMHNDWPLWPKTDAADFERFINYQQVITVPIRLRVINAASAVAWVGYSFCILMLGIHKIVAKKQQKRVTQ